MARREHRPTVQAPFFAVGVGKNRLETLRLETEKKVTNRYCQEVCVIPEVAERALDSPRGAHPRSLKTWRISRVLFVLPEEKLGAPPCEAKCAARPW